MTTTHAKTVPPPWHGFVIHALLSLLVCTVCRAADTPGRVEATFDLPQITGNPFDYLVNDVQVTFTHDDQRITLPAFYDGDTTWRARCAGAGTGGWKVDSITVNGKPADAAVRIKQYTSPQPWHGFVRVDPTNKMCFAFDDGTPYYPLGYNLAWRYPGFMPPLTVSLAVMGRSGVNWARIWMNYWDGKNLDWTLEKSDQPPLGHLSLDAARLWDDVVAAADDNGVRFQLVLQHHGQVNTRNDTNWRDHPWNKDNGGWLESPVEFFRDPKAIALTKAKYRYILARYAYSPAVMAWELFNEVESADAFEKERPAVIAWHADMARFLREQDPYHHLITTSSRLTEPALWKEMDYYQSHVYPPDVLTAIQSLDEEKLDKPYFYGEIGAANAGTANPAPTVHRALWASLMSRASGAAQYWHWEVVEPQNLLSHYTAVRKFLTGSALEPYLADFRPIDVGITTAARAPLRFGPGTGWAPAKTTRFLVKSNGNVEGVGGMSAYLQGDGENRAMFPFAEFDVDYAVPGTFELAVDEITSDGARIEISLDGQRATSLRVGAVAPPPSSRGTTRPDRPRRNVAVDASIEVPVPVGRHKIRVENTGRQWAHLRHFTLAPYAPELAVLAKGDARHAILWTYARYTSASPVTGQLSIPGLAAGRYRVVWWDTHAGVRVSTESLTLPENQSSLMVKTPPVSQDLAAWIIPAP